ncbi:heparinase [Flavobacterium sp. LMO8]|uniref:heparinase II/III domain-containing protein n=1 Tax=Flavobacterium sp. LMO8 TaxID=2654244 RepID=UPI00129287C8|nr:heparinase II/III family protein [Flavobacterium sp. LMO8]MQP24426.1 heparinase [Flavobacterium sp. LMO8]
MRFLKKYSFLFILFASFIQAQEHPNLILTKKGVQEIRQQLGKVPLFDASLADVKEEVDAEMLKPISVPIPKDMAGGFTHEQHKKNYLILQKAGVLYQILNEEKYAIYVRDVLLEYAKMYPKLPLHPQERSYARGKIFWQCLNDSNWMVYMSQAYDCVYDFLSKKERTCLEKDLFKPAAHFLSVESPQFFNRIHNHSTWGNVGVGMIGLVMNDKTYIDYALNGLKKDGIAADARDNDGGLIKKPGQKTGFLANLDDPFSPDGYYTEGPYYQRYAMYPFMIFAEALQNSKPEMKIFEYKNGVLLKSVYALLNLTNSEGEFFPLNDGQKGMSYYSRELVSAVDIAYYYGNQDASLLSIAKKQDRVSLDNTGLKVAMAIRDGLDKPFEKKSLLLTDGSDGKQGSVGIIRSKKDNNEFTLVMKNTSQGLSHGHYDKMSFSYYNNSNEILQDYGLARFVNVEQKNGGGYLKENKTWAKQTIAHNTLIQDETSHFNNDFETGSKHFSELFLFDDSNKNVQIVSAKENNAYPDSQLHRTMVVLNLPNFENPVLLDIFDVKSNAKHQYDLPYYYNGQFLATNFKYESPKTLEPLGAKNGYQHLWKEGSAIVNDNKAQFTWMNNNQFYSLTTATSKSDEIILARTGANDPEFNLRRDPTFIIRKKDTQNATFVTAIETHGSYSYVTESAKNAYSNIHNLEIVFQDATYIGVKIIDKKGVETLFIFNSKNNDASQKNEITINNKVYNWTGTYYKTNIE